MTNNIVSIFFGYSHGNICFKSNKNGSVLRNQTHSNSTSNFQYFYCWRKIQLFIIFWLYLIFFFLLNDSSYWKWAKMWFRSVSDRIQVYCQICVIYYTIVFCKQFTVDSLNFCGFMRNKWLKFQSTPHAKWEKSYKQKMSFWKNFTRYCT